MANYEIPFLNWLSLEQTKEEEFQMEVDTREILNSENLEEIRRLCATLYKENWAKDQLLKSCLGRIGELEGQLIVCRRKYKKLSLLTLLKKVLNRKGLRSS